MHTDTEELNSAEGCTPLSQIFLTLWSNISDEIRKYFSLFIRGLDGFKSWKKEGRKSRDTPLKVWQWANRSRCSLQKSNREQITLNFFKKRAKSVIRSWFKRITLKKREIPLEKKHIFHMFLTVFPLFMPKSDSLLLLFFKCKMLFRSQKMSDSLKKTMSKFPTLVADPNLVPQDCSRPKNKIMALDSGSNPS